MTDEVRAARERAREYRDFARGEVGRVLNQYRRLKKLLSGGSRIRRAEIEEVLGKGASMSDARCYTLTIDLIIVRVDRAIGVQGACLAVGHRLLTETKWEVIAENISRPLERCKEIVNDATGLLFTEFLAREITDHYKSEIAA